MKYTALMASASRSPDQLLSEVKVRRCPTCGHRHYRRLPRDGFMERSVLAFFGLFPWECRLCQRRLYLWNRGSVTAPKPD
jgi:hypothetical protein